MTPAAVHSDSNKLVLLL